MKIIAESKKDTYLCQLTENEIANILGYYSTCDTNFPNLHKCITTEKELEISKIFKNAYKVKGIVENSQYTSARLKLQEMLTGLSGFEDLITNLNNTYETD